MVDVYRRHGPRYGHARRAWPHLRVGRRSRLAPKPARSVLRTLPRSRTHDRLLIRSSARTWRAGLSQLGCRLGLAGSDREVPRFTVLPGTQRARAYFGEHLIRSDLQPRLLPAHSTA